MKKGVNMEEIKRTSKGDDVRRRKTLSKVIKVVLALIVLAVVAFASIKIYSSLTMTDADRAVAETERTRDDVAKLMDLPSEEPTITTVSDAENLKKQPFFAATENGDKILIFIEARKVVLYRPSTNRIINSGPILDDSAGSEEKANE
jgi:cell division protein FtsL